MCQISQLFSDHTLHQIIPNKRNTIGVRSEVKIPFSVNPKLEYAPYFLLTSIAAEVPMA